jgi:hypothetical protein
MSLDRVPLLLPLNLAATTAQRLTFLQGQLMRKISTHMGFTRRVACSRSMNMAKKPPKFHSSDLSSMESTRDSVDKEVITIYGLYLGPHND